MSRLSKTEPFDLAQISHLSRLLGQIGDPRAVPALAKYLMSDIPTIRTALAEALRNPGRTREGVEAMLAHMKVADVGRRSAFCVVLAELGEPVLDPVVRALKDPAPEVRNGASWTLGYLKDLRGARPLLAALADTNEHVRAAAAWALGQIGDTNAISPLVSLLADPVARARLGAVEGLSEIGGSHVSSALAEALSRDTSAEVRAAIVLALGKTGDGSALSLLKKTEADDRSPAVRQNATRAVLEIRQRIDAKRLDVR